MNAVVQDISPTVAPPSRYARIVKASKKIEWQIDRDLMRGRGFDFSKSFLPDGLSYVDRLPFLGKDDARLLSQVQGRTYAYLFGLVERFISAKMLEQSRAHVLGDQQALEGLVRFSAEEMADPNDVARAVLAASTWAVLALTCHIELFVQSHYDQSIAPRADICPLFKDVFWFHWKDECQHVMLDELEWSAEHAKLDAEARDRAVNDLIALVGAVDGILQAQSAADVDYFLGIAGRTFADDERKAIADCVLAAYRWQYIISGVQHLHFGRLLTSMTTPEQMARIQAALAPIMQG
jgi:hypothetical protein